MSVTPKELVGIVEQSLVEHATDLSEGQRRRIVKKLRRAHSKIGGDPPFNVRFHTLTNIALRELWREEHGSPDEWDATCRAAGHDPSIYQSLVAR